MHIQATKNNKSSGYIYVASYDGYPNALKIGLTRICPIKRVESMNINSLTIGTFTLSASYRTANVHDIEREIHLALSESRICKEFFSVDIDTAKRTIESLILSEDFSESGSLTKKCVHLIDFDKNETQLGGVDSYSVVVDNRVDFYVLSKGRMKELLEAENKLKNLDIHQVIQNHKKR